MSKIAQNSSVNLIFLVYVCHIFPYLSWGGLDKVALPGWLSFLIKRKVKNRRGSAQKLISCTYLTKKLLHLETRTLNVVILVSILTFFLFSFFSKWKDNKTYLICKPMKTCCTQAVKADNQVLWDFNLHWPEAWTEDASRIYRKQDGGWWWLLITWQKGRWQGVVTGIRAEAVLLSLCCPSQKAL